MKIKKFSLKPADIESRVGADPVVCYPNDSINNNLEILHEARKHIKKIDEVSVDTVKRVAKKIISGPIAISSIGPIKNLENIEQIQNRFN